MAVRGLKMPETIRILCVDDEINILNVVRRQLDDEMFEIHTALTAEEGLRILRQVRSIDVVLSDYRMPEMDGIEFLRRVIQERRTAVGIILSGFADVPSVKEAIENDNLFRFISKPWKAEDLHRNVIEAAALAKGRRDEGLMRHEGKKSPYSLRR